MDLLPRHIINVENNLQHFIFEKKKINNKYKRTLHSFQVKLLYLEISEQHYKLKDLTYFLLDLEEFLEINLLTNIIREFYNTQKLRLDRIKDKCLFKKTKKLDNLYEEKYKSNNYDTDNKWFINLSNKNISREVVNVSHWDKFSTKKNISKIDKIEFIICIETNIYNFCKIDPNLKNNKKKELQIEPQNEIQNDIRQKLTQCIHDTVKKENKMRHSNHYDLESSSMKKLNFEPLVYF